MKTKKKFENFRVLAMIMVLVLMATSLVGCGDKETNKTEDTVVEATEMKNTEVAANTEATEELETEEAFVVPTSTYDGLTFVEPGYDEYVLSDMDFDEADITFKAPTDLNLYSIEGRKVAEVKEGVELHMIGLSSHYAWTMIENPVKDTVYENLYLNRDLEIDEIVLAATAPKQEVVANNKPNKPFGEASKPTEKPETAPEPTPPTDNTPVEEAPVVDDSKYTPEEAVAVYKSTLEASGVAWNPSIKEFASDSTGMIPLNKSECEAQAKDHVLRFQMGDTVGHSYRNYYMEVTGSDDIYVYYHQWRCE